MARAHDTLDDLVWITRYLAKPAAGQDLLPSRLERRTGLATGAFTSFAGTDATLPMDRLVIQVQLFDGHATSHTKHSGSEIVTREELNLSATAVGTRNELLSACNSHCLPQGIETRT
jgi:hypothetical protein